MEGGKSIKINVRFGIKEAVKRSYRKEKFEKKKRKVKWRKRKKKLETQTKGSKTGKQRPSIVMRIRGREVHGFQIDTRVNKTCR